MLAGEYALRVLEGDELAAARRRLLSEPDFAAEVDWWQDRLGTWAEQITPVTPASAVWPAIAARIDAAGGSGGGADVVPIRRGPAGWSIALALSGLGAAAAAIALYVSTPETIPFQVPGPPQIASEEGRLVAQLASEELGVQLASIVDPSTHILSLNATGLAPGAGKAAELWIIPAGGAPVSLGLIPADGKLSRELDADEAVLMQAGATMAVTYENAQGAPHEAPTLPIIVAGGLGEV